MFYSKKRKNQHKKAGGVLADIPGGELTYVVNVNHNDCSLWSEDLSKQHHDNADNAFHGFPSLVQKYFLRKHSSLSRLSTITIRLNISILSCLMTRLNISILLCLMTRSIFQF